VSGSWRDSYFKVMLKSDSRVTCCWRDKDGKLLFHFHWDYHVYQKGDPNANKFILNAFLVEENVRTKNEILSESTQFNKILRRIVLEARQDSHEICKGIFLCFSAIFSMFHFSAIS
jgi:hypothetical protein